MRGSLEERARPPPPRPPALRSRVERSLQILSDLQAPALRRGPPTWPCSALYEQHPTVRKSLAPIPEPGGLRFRGERALPSGVSPSWRPGESPRRPVGPYLFSNASPLNALPGVGWINVGCRPFRILAPMLYMGKPRPPKGRRLPQTILPRSGWLGCADSESDYGAIPLWVAGETRREEAGRAPRRVGPSRAGDTAQVTPLCIAAPPSGLPDLQPHPATCWAPRATVCALEERCS